MRHEKCRLCGKWRDDCACGPEYYSDLGKDVASFRKLARHGLAEMPMLTRRGYGNAVLSAIRAKHRQALMRETPSHSVDCASGTNHNSGNAILKAVRAANAGKAFRNLRFDQNEANRKYEQAIAEKRFYASYNLAA